MNNRLGGERLCAAVLILLAASGAAGCSSDKVDTTDVTVEVTEQDGTPIDAAGVSVEDAAGTIHKAQTGSDGRVTLPIEVAGGGVSVLAHKDGYVFWSITGITEERATDGEALLLELPILTPTSDELLEVSGTVTGFSTDPNLFVITNSTRPGSSGAQDGMYSMPVAPEQAFAVSVLEYHEGVEPISARGQSLEHVAWLRFDNDAITDDSTVDLDLSTPASQSSVSGSFAIPEYYRDFGTGFVGVNTITDVGIGDLTGLYELTDVSSDSSMVEHTTTYVDAPGEEAATRYSIGDGNGKFSRRWVSGLPAEGDAGVELFEPVEPELAADPQPLHAPVTWKVSPDAATADQIRMTVELIVNGGERQLLGVVLMAPDATETRLIELPEGTDLAASLSGLLNGHIVVCENGPILPGTLCDADAGGAYFVMTAP
jgi:hypothetical protein